jgi:thioredoxin-related protein
MKKCIALIMLLATVSYTVKAQDGIRFIHGTWAELLAKAKEENKLIFMDAFAEWCGPCKKMSNDIFPQKEVGNYYNANFIPVKMDMEKGDGVFLAKLYNVSAYPTLLFINWKGEVVHRSVGGRQAEALIELGKEALDDTKNFRAVEQAYMKDPKDVDKVIAYASALKKGYDKSYQKIVLAYAGSIPPDDLKSQNGWTLISSFVEDPNSDVFKYFIKNKVAFETIAGKEAVDTKLNSIIQVMINQALRKKNAEAMEDLYVVIGSLYPEKADYYKKYANIEYQRSSNNWPAFGFSVLDLLKIYPEKDSQKLNSYAWDFYLHVDDQAQLKSMAKTVGELIKTEDSYAIHDTWASLLFKTKNYKQALKEAKAAIELARKEGVPFEETQELVNEIEKAMK